MSDLESGSNYSNHCSPVSGISKESRDSDSESLSFEMISCPIKKKRWQVLAIVKTKRTMTMLKTRMAFPLELFWNADSKKKSR